MNAAGLVLSLAVLHVGGFGLGAGVPPQPEPALFAKIAPEECLFYMSAAAEATPEADSKNKTEQLLAEPEVAALMAEIDRISAASMVRALESAMQGDNAPKAFSAEEIVDLLKLAKTCPAAVYISKFESGREGPAIRGGAMIRVGDDTAAREQLESAFGKIAPAGAETVEIGGQEWHRFTPAPKTPVVWGFRGKYFLIGVGEGEIEAMVERAKGSAPGWLTTLRKDLALERFSTITYVNVKGILRAALPASDSKTDAMLNVLGLSNVKAIGAATGLDRECFVTRARAVIDGEPQGLFKLATAGKLAAADFAGVPREANFAMATKFDVAAAFDMVCSIAEKVDPKAQAGTLGGLAAFEQKFGIKLREELLQSLGDAWVVHELPSAPMGPARLVATVSLKDPSKFRAAYRKVMAVLEKQGPAGAGVPSIAKAAGVNQDAYSLSFGPMMPVGLSWCVSDKAIVFALQPQGLSAYLSKPAAGGSLADVPAVAGPLGARPEPTSLVYVNIPALFDQFYPMLSAAGPMIAAQLSAQGIEFDPSILPPAETIRKHLLPDVAVVGQTSSGIVFTERTALPGMSVGATGAGVGVGLLLPAIQAAREAARRQVSMNNMKQIGLAMHNYNFANKTFPPAYKTDKDDKPLLSWRVLILPYLGEEKLYKQFKLDEPWDSDHNKQLVAKMPAVYRNPNSTVADQGKTNYLTPRGEKTAFPGAKGMTIADITDGSSNTFLTLEVSDDNAVEWTKPDDFEYDDSDPLKGLVGLRSGGFLAGLADGSVRFIAATTDTAILVALFTRNGGEAATLGP